MEDIIIHSPPLAEVPKDLALYNNNQKIIAVGGIVIDIGIASPTFYEFNSSNGALLHAGVYSLSPANAYGVGVIDPYNFIFGWKWADFPPSGGGVTGFTTLKTDESGSPLWVANKWRALPDPAQYTEEGCEELAIDRDGNIYVTGELSENYTNGPTYWWVLKYHHNNGTLLWEKNFGEGNGFSVEILAEQKILVAGYLTQPYYRDAVFYLEPTGDTVWSIELSPSVGGRMKVRSYVHNDSIYFYIMRSSFSTTIVSKYGFLFVYNKENSFTTTKNNFSHSLIYKDGMILKLNEKYTRLNIYTITGKKIIYLPNKFKIQKLPTGVYFLNLFKEGKEIAKFKLIKF